MKKLFFFFFIIFTSNALAWSLVEKSCSEQAADAKTDGGASIVYRDCLEKEKQKKREKILNSKDWKDCEQKKIRELGAPKTNLDRAVITFSCEKDLNVSLQ